jgi:hypothetical protein
MPKVYETAADLPGQYRQIAAYFANPHVRIYEPLDVFYDFLQGDWRTGEYRRLHGGPTGCACDVCAAKAGRPTYVQPLASFARERDPDWVLWGDGRYVAVDAHGDPIAAGTPCEGKMPGRCSCYWCRPYYYDASLTNHQALEKLMAFVAPLVPAARGARLEREQAALRARLAAVERELNTRTYQTELI